MGKLTTLLLMMSGLNLLFYFTGLSTSSNALLNNLLQPSTILIASVGSFVAYQAFLVLANTASSGISIGSFFSNLRYALIAPFVLFLFKVFGDFMIVVNKIAEVNTVFAILFLSPMLVIFVMTIIAFWDSTVSA